MSRVRKVDIFHRGSEATAANTDGAADQKRHPVFLVGADDEGEDGESGEAQHAQHWAGTLSGGKSEESALADGLGH